MWGRKLGSFQLIFFCAFHFLFGIPKVNNYNNNHKCLLRNQNDILDNPIPCKLTLLVYSIWNTKWRYDRKYASQYKSKHTNYVKLSNWVITLLHTHSWYPTRECPLEEWIQLSVTLIVVKMVVEMMVLSQNGHEFKGNHHHKARFIWTRFVLVQ